jgi:hemerythrin
MRSVPKGISVIYLRRIAEVLLICASPRYYKAVSELKDIRGQRLKLLAQIRQLRAVGEAVVTGRVAKASFKIVVTQLQDALAKEDRFLRSYGHPSCASHTAEHQRILRELSLEAARLNSGDVVLVTELSHAFDSYLIHSAIEDDSDFVRVDVRCRPLAQGVCLS